MSKGQYFFVNKQHKTTSYNTKERFKGHKRENVIKKSVFLKNFPKMQ